GDPGHLPARRQGRDQVLPHTAHRPGVPAESTGHRQARQLPGGAPTADAQRGAPSVEVSEQPRGELPPPQPGPGTSHETLHLTWARPAVPVRLQRDIPTLPTRPPPTRRRGIPTRN